MQNKLLEYEKLLSDKNFKLTFQRRLILKILLENDNKHLSADEIYQLVREKNPKVGLATVYRTVELLHELGILQELDFDDDCRRYEIDQGEEHHHHLICLQCGKIVEFNDHMLKDLEEHIHTYHHFNVVDHRIKFFGYCSDCQKERE